MIDIKIEFELKLKISHSRNKVLFLREKNKLKKKVASLEDNSKLEEIL